MDGVEIGLRLDCSEFSSVLQVRKDAFIYRLIDFLPNFWVETDKFFLRNHKLIENLNMVLNALVGEVCHIYSPRSRHKDIEETYLLSIENLLESLFVPYHIKVDFHSDLKPNSITLTVFLKNENIQNYNYRERFSHM